MDEIDFDGPVPVYQQIANILRGFIHDGTIPSGRAIPSKRELVQRYGVAEGTVERALDVLKREGMIFTVIGRGLYVSGHRTED